MARSASSAGIKGEALVGKVLSERYRIDGLLGEGGMGTVYLAEHLLMHKKFALKVLNPAMTQRPEVCVRFEREAMAAAHIEHPNVAAASDFGKLDDGSCFLVLEYVEGTDLFGVIGKGRLEPERALHIAHQIAAALARAHSIGIVHRDLKPENVMLVERDGDPDFVKVLDFGIAKVPVGPLGEGATPPGLTVTQVGVVYGTPEYMSPEQALGQEVDGRTDLYALGVILYEMLAGVRPFEAASKTELLGMKVMTPAPTIARKNPKAPVSDSIESLVRRLLERDADDRFQDASEVRDAIEASGRWSAKTRGSVQPPRVRFERRRQRIVRSLQKMAQAATRRRPLVAAVLRRYLPRELLAGIGAGLLLVGLLLGVFRGREILSVDRATASPTATTTATTTATATTTTTTTATATPMPSARAFQDDPSANPRSTTTTADFRPSTAPTPSSRTAPPPKAPVRRNKRLPGNITDFGGRL